MTMITFEMSFLNVMSFGLKNAIGTFFILFEGF
jgi:hypothetical protein